MQISRIKTVCNLCVFWGLKVSSSLLFLGCYNNGVKMAEMRLSFVSCVAFRRIREKEEGK